MGRGGFGRDWAPLRTYRYCYPFLPPESLESLALSQRSSSRPSDLSAPFNLAIVGAQDC